MRNGRRGMPPATASPLRERRRTAVNIKSIKRRSEITIEEARRRHPSAAVIWTPQDFTDAAEQAMAIVAQDTATVYDFTTGEVIA